MLGAYKKTMYNEISGEFIQERKSFAHKPTQIHREYLLANLLQSERILDNLQTLEESYRTSVSDTSSHLRNPGTIINTVMHKIYPFLAKQNELSDWLRVIPINPHDLSLPQSASIDMSFQRVQEVIKFLPEIARAYRVTVVLGALLRWQYCRCILVIYQFISTDLPRLAFILFMGHRLFTSPYIGRNFCPDSPQGNSWLEELYPNYAKLVLHILAYVKTWINFHNSTVKARAANPLPSDFGKIPFNFFGLRDGDGPPVQLPPLLKSLRRNPDVLYIAARDCFIKLIEDNLILPTIPDVDRYFNKGRTRTEDDLKAIRARCIVRGAVLECIVTHMGTEAIFASEYMHVLLASPTLIFYDGSVNETRIDTFILAHRPEFTSPLRAWLRKHVKEPSIDAAVQLGNFFQRCGLEFQFNRHISRQEFEASTAEEIQAKLLKQKVNRNAGPKRTPTIQTLLSQGDLPHYGGPMLLLDEALRKVTGRPSKRSQARLFLEGHC